MHIEERKVTVREVTEGYFNDAEEGVVGYDEQLDIRPKYQREFVYKDKQRDEVIRTVMKGLLFVSSSGFQLRQRFFSHVARKGFRFGKGVPLSLFGFAS